MTRHFAKFILALFTFFASLCLHAGIYEFFFPWLGAEAKICLRVVDDLGKPVEGAKVTGYFHFTEAMKTRTVRVTTDADGCAELKENCDNTVAIEITKDGYYQSEEAIDYGKPGHALKGGKWFPYGELKTYVLKEQRNPVPLYSFFHPSFNVPSADQEYGYDLEYGDLVKPYGEGETADFLIKYTCEKSVGKEVRTLHLLFPNAMDGAYVFSPTKESKLWSPHHADAEAQYTKEIAFQIVYDTSGKFPTWDEASIPRDRAFILRTRSKVDANGTLVSARYGKIYGEVVFVGYEPPVMNGTLIVYLNPNANDTNLEARDGYIKELEKGVERRFYHAPY